MNLRKKLVICKKRVRFVTILLSYSVKLFLCEIPEIVDIPLQKRIFLENFEILSNFLANIKRVTQNQDIIG